MNKWVLEEALRRDAVRQRRCISKSVKCLEGHAAGVEESVYFYRLVPESEVSGDRVRAALQMLEFCQRKLKIKTLNLAWFEMAGSRDEGAKVLGSRRVKGFITLPDTIHLASWLDPREVYLAAAHEAHHAWLESQPEGRFASLNADDRENSANAFAFMMWQELRELHPEYWWKERRPWDPNKGWSPGNS